MRIKEIVVVEGKEDTRRLKEVFPHIDTIETRGSAIDEETINIIKHAQETRGVIIFTDPDYPGQRIRHIINTSIPGCKNAYIDKEKAISVKKGKVGVEHCSEVDLKEALNNIIEIEDEASDLDYSDLIDMNLIGGEESAKMRFYISQKLRIGYNNSKQFYKKLKMFNIKKQTLIDLLEQYIKEE